MQQHDVIPEMELEALVKLMRAFFQIATDRVEGRPYSVRFIESPYNPFVEDCRSIQVSAHNRGTRMSPHNIKAVLAKFEIKEPDFLEALAKFEADIFLPDGSSGVPDGAKPN